jgi:hypothetical protein
MGRVARPKRCPIAHRRDPDLPSIRNQDLQVEPKTIHQNKHKLVKEEMVNGNSQEDPT